MTIEPAVFTVISLLSGLIGAALLVRYKVSETSRRFEAHEEKDETHHQSVLNRLTTLEVKIDILLERKP